MAKDVGGESKSLDITGIAEVTKELRDFVYNIVGPWSEEVGKELADRRRLRRFGGNLQLLLEEARRILEEQGIEAQVVAPKLLLPVLENAVLEDDEELQHRWAGLLASASAGEKVPPAYPKILSELSGNQAKFLDALERGMISVSIYPTSLTIVPTWRAETEKGDQPSIREDAVFPEHLEGLGLCKTEAQRSPFNKIATALQHLSNRSSSKVADLERALRGFATAMEDDAREKERATLDVSLTPFGRGFVLACKGPQPRKDSPAGSS